MRRGPAGSASRASDRIFLFCVYLLLAVFLAVVLLPLLYIVASSFSSPAAVSSGRVLFWPVEFSLRGYHAVFQNPQIVQGYLNSLFYTVVGTIVSVTLTIAIAYPMSRRTLVGRNVVMTLILFTMLFTGGLIPTYLVVQSAGLLDTRWALIIPQAIGVWQVIIARTYFRTAIPDELVEAARTGRLRRPAVPLVGGDPVGQADDRGGRADVRDHAVELVLRRPDLSQEPGSVPAPAGPAQHPDPQHHRRWGRGRLRRACSVSNWPICSSTR